MVRLKCYGARFNLIVRIIISERSPSRVDQNYCYPHTQTVLDLLDGPQGDYYLHTYYITLWGVPLAPPPLRSPLLIRGISTLPQGAQYFEWNFFPKKWVRGGYFINKIFRFYFDNWSFKNFNLIIYINKMLIFKFIHVSF